MVSVDMENLDKLSERFNLCKGKLFRKLRALKTLDFILTLLLEEPMCSRYNIIVHPTPCCL